MTSQLKKLLLLTSIAVVIIVSIVDLTIHEDDVFEDFANRVLNEQRTEAYEYAHPEATATARGQLDIEAGGINEVSLANQGGDITVKRAAQSTLQVQYTVQVTAADEASAKRKQEAVEIEQQTSGGRLTLSAKASGEEIDHETVSIDYVLLVPDGLKLSMESESGSVVIRGIHGELQTTIHDGLLDIAGVEGDIAVTANYGNLSLTDIKGNITFNNIYSDLNLEHVEGSLVMDSFYGRAYLSRVTGGITASDESGALRLSDVDGPVKVDSTNSEVQFDHIRNAMQFHSKHGEITALLTEAEGAALAVQVRNGSIRTPLPLTIERDADDPSVEQLTGAVGAGTWRLDIQAVGTEVYIHSKREFASP